DYDIYYRAHVQNIGWQDWVKNGELAGTSGQSLRLEALEIKISAKLTTNP
ncbi:peptidoglycan-binding protein LysM, partial [Candidatus Saccharibacteria bacterium]|nr:peptidoglycan-binding protein LysM [Candidatus Saccharibacteria bacterium]